MGGWGRGGEGGVLAYETLHLLAGLLVLLACESVHYFIGMNVIW